MSATLRVAVVPNVNLALTNLGFIPPTEFALLGGVSSDPLPVLLNGAVICVVSRDDVAPGVIELSLFLRRTANAMLGDPVLLTSVSLRPEQRISGIKFNVDVIARAKYPTALPVDVNVLGVGVCSHFCGQVLQMGQEVCYDYDGHMLKLSVSDLVSGVGSDPRLVRCGLFTPTSTASFGTAYGALVDLFHPSNVTSVSHPSIPRGVVSDPVASVTSPLLVTALSSSELALTNVGYVNPAELTRLGGDASHPLPLLINAAVISVLARDSEDVPPGVIALSAFQRRSAQAVLGDDVVPTPITLQPCHNIASIELTVDALQRKEGSTVPVVLDTALLADRVCAQLCSLVVQPGQDLAFDFDGLLLKLTVSEITQEKVSVVEDVGLPPLLQRFGVCLPTTAITFRKAKDSPITLRSVSTTVY